MSTIFKLGDVVTYKREFLRATGQLSGPIPFARGRIISLSPVSKALDVATINWSEPDIPTRVLTSNLIRADRLHLESY
jgi:hypothetical protein